jgi:hypothetical protein
MPSSSSFANRREQGDPIAQITINEGLAWLKATNAETMVDGPRKTQADDLVLQTDTSLVVAGGS